MEKATLNSSSPTLSLLTVNPGRIGVIFKAGEFLKKIYLKLRGKRWKISRFSHAKSKP